MANSHITSRGRLQPVIFLFAALCGLASAPADAQQSRENPYDVVGKALVPLARVIIAPGSTKNHAFTCTLALDSATGLPAEDAGSTLQVALESPDKLKLRLNLPSGTVTICRNGQAIWASPGALVDALLATQDLPKADPDFKIGKFTLPVTEKQLVLLPVLFKVKDAGDEPVAGVPCRVLDLTLMPELAHSLKAEAWMARIWVRADYQVVKIELARQNWNVTVLVKDAAYAPSLPAETWQPSHDEAMDMTQIKPTRYKQLLDLIVSQWTAYKSGK